ncbi:MAG: pyridoxamine 5'-phosphate oxidase family protein [Candidatus Thorarchaeota archaeon]|jgi:nitroimidazol reductase NimA-like FMN-containing flavoprotein (pyridoxamine 5'-phosphate oxidase superfamily)
MKGIRRKEKAIESTDEMVHIIKEAKYITIAMCKNNTPYLATLSHGYDDSKKCIYFHCARDGKKIDILQENNLVWGQAVKDLGYVAGKCDHLFATTQFMGRVQFIEDMSEKRHALTTMVNDLEPDPQKVVDDQFTEKSIARVNIGRIDIEYMSGKKSDEVVISL